MNDTLNYQPGDIANGHILNTEGEWVPTTTSMPAVSKRRKVGAGIAFSALMVAATAATVSMLTGVLGNSGPLAAVADKCGTDSTVTVSDESVTVDTGSKYGSLTGLDCVRTTLETSPALITRMMNTNSLMGWQTATEDGFSYGWSYHPDNGMLLVVTSAG